MLIKLHSQATTIPKIRATIEASDEPAWIVAERHGTSEQTVAAALRLTPLRVSLADLLSVVHAFLTKNAQVRKLAISLRNY